LENNDSISKVSGLVFATCCHHLCTWDSYVGLDHLKKWGIKPEYLKLSLDWLVGLYVELVSQGLTMKPLKMRKK